MDAEEKRLLAETNQIRAWELDLEDNRIKLRHQRIELAFAIVGAIGCCAIAAMVIVAAIDGLASVDLPWRRGFAWCSGCAALMSFVSMMVMVSECDRRIVLFAAAFLLSVFVFGLTV